MSKRHKRYPSLSSASEDLWNGKLNLFQIIEVTERDRIDIYRVVESENGDAFELSWMESVVVVSAEEFEMIRMKRKARHGRK